MIKRKTSQTYWELESIYYRACRITGFKPDTEAYKDLDYKDIYMNMVKPATLFDGRNILDIDSIRTIGFNAKGIGVG